MHVLPWHAHTYTPIHLYKYICFIFLQYLWLTIKCVVGKLWIKYLMNIMPGHNANTHMHTYIGTCICVGEHSKYLPIYLFIVSNFKCNCSKGYMAACWQLWFTTNRYIQTNTYTYILVMCCFTIFTIENTCIYTYIYIFHTMPNLRS